MLRRLATIGLGLALLSSWSHASILHIHAYGDHDHPEHRHGPAAHEHEAPPHESDVADDGAHVKGCEPGRHSVAVVVLCTPLQQTHSYAAASVAPVILDADAVAIGLAAMTDVRAHGPPGLTQASPRAPPACSPA